MKTREDWLVNQLDNNASLSPHLRARYEAELESHGDSYDRAALAKKIKAQAEGEHRARMRSLLMQNDVDLVVHFGEEEFGSDYELVEEGSDFVVYSKVARDDQNDRRVHATREKAEADRRYLMWNRLYSKYVRSGEITSLGELAE